MKKLITICKTTIYKKPQKNALFPAKNIFVRADGLNLGSKFE